MIETTAPQGSPAWHGFRRGIPTASQSSRIVTPDGKPARKGTIETYMRDLIAERFTPAPKEDKGYQSWTMERGHLLEPRARACIQLAFGPEIREAGFIYRDAARRFGASPDGFAVDMRAGAEIKSPEPKELLRIADAVARGKVAEAVAPYAGQMQFGMYCAGLFKWYFCAFTDAPELPCITLEIEADSKAFAGYGQHVPEFCDELEERTKGIEKAFGCERIHHGEKTENPNTERDGEI